jgi:ribulose-5-phosphate 4-epimerase/fuculose-1-phosphate aldolase
MNKPLNPTELLHSNPATHQVALSGAEPASVRSRVGEAEWSVRVDLAAAYRAAAHFGWNDTIYNHFTARVPGEPDYFLVKRHGHMFDEVTASSLVKVHVDGRALSFDDDVNPAAFAIHMAVLRARPDVQAILHVHTPMGVALSARPEGFLYLNQEAAFFYDRISYHHFDGIEERPDDAVKLAGALASHHHSLILSNHGVVATGHTVQSALVRMQYLLLCAQSQLMACAPSTPPRELAPELCIYTRDQFEAQERATDWVAEMAAIRRLVDRKLPGYAD